MTKHCISGAQWGGALLLSAAVASVAILPPLPAHAAAAKSFLDGVRRQTTLTSTVPENGDQNSYAIVVAPVSAGAI